MKRLLAALVFWTHLATPSFGEICFDWSMVSVPKEEQQQFEADAKAMALKYTDPKFAPERPYNFITSPVTYTIVVANEVRVPEGNGEIRTPAKHDWFSKKISVEKNVLSKKGLCKILIFHELGHAYRKLTGLTKTFDEKTLNEEHVAIARGENILLQENENDFPKDIYNKLMACYSEEAFRTSPQEIYIQRSKPLNDWWLDR